MCLKTLEMALFKKSVTALTVESKIGALSNCLSLSCSFRSWPDFYYGFNFLLPTGWGMCFPYIRNSHYMLTSDWSYLVGLLYSPNPNHNPSPESNLSTGGEEGAFVYMTGLALGLIMCTVYK